MMYDWRALASVTWFGYCCRVTFDREPAATEKLIFINISLYSQNYDVSFLYDREFPAASMHRFWSLSLLWYPYIAKLFHSPSNNGCAYSHDTPRILTPLQRPAPQIKVRSVRHRLIWGNHSCMFSLHVLCASGFRDFRCSVSGWFCSHSFCPYIIDIEPPGEMHPDKYQLCMAARREQSSWIIENNYLETCLCLWHFHSFAHCLSGQDWTNTNLTLASC